jgi:hypothetical protein
MESLKMGYPEHLSKKHGVFSVRC